MKKSKIGRLGWIDLTVDDVEKVRDFYKEVFGLEYSKVNMGDYHDYYFKDPETKEWIMGICSKKGVNSDLPSQWLMYVIVEDINKSLRKVKKLGGKVLKDVVDMGDVKYAVIEDMSGAVCCLYESYKENWLYN